MIEQALRSIQSVVDEIIVIDTGSTDDTIIKAQALGAHVWEIPWTNDFSAARNAALDHTHGDWILVLDADEALMAEDIHIIREAITHPTADAYNLRIVSLADKAEYLSEARVTRLFRNDPRIRWSGRIHEQLIPQLAQAGLSLAALDARLLHYGYLSAVMDDKNKVARNLTMLQDIVKQQPGNAYWMWQLAQTELQAHHPEATVMWVKRAMKLLPPTADLQPLFITTLARGYSSQQLWHKSSQVLQEGLRLFPTYTDFAYMLGIFDMQQQRWDEAERWMKKCLALGTPQGYLQTETGVGHFKAVWQLVRISLAQEQPQRAEAYLLQLVKMQPAFREAWQTLIQLLLGNPWPTIIQHIQLVMDPAQIVAALNLWTNLTPVEIALQAAARKEITHAASLAKTGTE